MGVRCNERKPNTRTGHAGQAANVSKHSAKWPRSQMAPNSITRTQAQNHRYDRKERTTSTTARIRSVRTTVQQRWCQVQPHHGGTLPPLPHKDTTRFLTTNVRLQEKQTAGRILRWQIPCSPHPSPSPSTYNGHAAEHQSETRKERHTREGQFTDTCPYQFPASSRSMHPQTRTAIRDAIKAPPAAPRVSHATHTTVPRLSQSPSTWKEDPSAHNKTHKSSRSVGDTDMPGTGGSSLSHSSSSLPSRRRATGDNALAAGNDAPRGGPLPLLPLMIAGVALRRGGGEGGSERLAKPRTARKPPARRQAARRTATHATSANKKTGKKWKRRGCPKCQEGHPTAEP